MVAPQLVHIDRWGDDELLRFARANRKRGEVATAVIGKSILENANWTRQVYEGVFARKFDTISENAIPDPMLRKNAKTKAATSVTCDFLAALGINRPRVTVAVGEWAVIMDELRNRHLGVFERSSRVRLDRGAAVVSIPDAIRAKGGRLEKSVLRVVHVRKSAFLKLQYAHDDREKAAKTISQLTLPLPACMMAHASSYSRHSRQSTFIMPTLIYNRFGLPGVFVCGLQTCQL